jgi:hypothetical protein
VIKSGTRVGIILLVASWSIVHFVGRVLLLGVRSDPLVADHPLARDNRRHVLEGSLGVATLVNADHNMRDLRTVSRLSECVRVCIRVWRDMGVGVWVSVCVIIHVGQQTNTPTQQEYHTKAQIVMIALFQKAKESNRFTITPCTLLNTTQVHIVSPTLLAHHSVLAHLGRDLLLNTNPGLRGIPSQALPDVAAQSAQSNDD